MPPTAKKKNYSIRGTARHKKNCEQLQSSVWTVFMTQRENYYTDWCLSLHLSNRMFATSNWSNKITLCSNSGSVPAADFRSLMMITVIRAHRARTQRQA